MKALERWVRPSSEKVGIVIVSRDDDACQVMQYSRVTPESQKGFYATVPMRQNPYAIYEIGNKESWWKKEAVGYRIAIGCPAGTA